MDDDLTVVIGAGAAGIAAARHLHDAGAPVLLVEAATRIGGRARSQALAPLLGTFGAAVPAGAAIDLGCGWLHSAARNPWTGIAEARGAAIDRSSPHWGEQWCDLGFPPAEQAAFATARDAWEAAALAAAHDPDAPDRPLSAFVDPADPWRPMLDAISGYANGAALDAVSVRDWAAYEEAAGDENWALPGGYGHLVAGHAAPVPLRLATPITRIDHRGRALKLEGPRGTLTAARAIVCVPTTMLATERLRFDPPLPAHHEAAAALPLGLADKLFLHVDRPPWPAHAHLIGDPHRAGTASYRLSPFGWPIVEAFFGGPCDEALEDDGAAAAFAIDELVALLGGDWRTRLTPLRATAWRRQPWVEGSYSHARIGHAAARLALAQPVDDRLFFAGEACSPADFSTAHGAHATGVAAAEAILAGRRALR